MLRTFGPSHSLIFVRHTYHVWIILKYYFSSIFIFLKMLCSHIINKSLCILRPLAPFFSGPSASHILRYLQYMRSITVSFWLDVHGLWCIMPKVHMRKVHRGPWCVTWPENSSVRYFLAWGFFFTCFFDVHWDPWCVTKHIFVQFTTHRDAWFEHPVETVQFNVVLCDPLVCWEYNLLF